MIANLIYLEVALGKILIILSFLFSQVSFAAARFSDFTYAFIVEELPGAMSDIETYAYQASKDTFLKLGKERFRGLIKKVLLTVHPQNNSPQVWVLSSSGELYFQGDSMPRAVGVIDICEKGFGEIYALFKNREVKEIHFNYAKFDLVPPLSGSEEIIAIDNPAYNELTYLTYQRVVHYHLGVSNTTPRWEVDLKTAVPGFSPVTITSPKSNNSSNNRVVISGFQQNNIRALVEIDATNSSKPIVVKRTLSVPPFKLALNLDMFEINDASELLFRLDDDLVTFPLGSGNKPHVIETDLLKIQNLFPQKNMIPGHYYTVFFDYPNISKTWLPRQLILLNSKNIPPRYIRILNAPVTTPVTKSLVSAQQPSHPPTGSDADPVTKEQFKNNIRGQIAKARIPLPKTAKQWSEVINVVGSLRYFTKNLTHDQAKEMECKKVDEYTLASINPTVEIDIEKIAEIFSNVRQGELGCNGPLQKPRS